MSQLLLCMGCGDFLRAIEQAGSLAPVNEEECPECGGTSFKDVRTDTVIRTDESSDESA